MALANRPGPRLRFCPSPTGTPHVGMIRTALFNWAWVKHTQGTLVFRIEDTDAARDSQASYQAIVESLRWLGLDWDEGMEVGGPFGPYRQSERAEIYRDALSRLVAAGWAYESYSTAEEIAERNLARGLNAQIGYDGFDRNLTARQISNFQAEGRRPTIRFRMPEEEIIFSDLVRGEIRFSPEYVPDYVLARADQTPLYTLTNPLDDALMEIDLVMRGEDLLSSTPRQIALYSALIDLGVAKRTPQFAHLPYVMGEGNKKLSKRDPESDLLLHRQNGMIPEGLLNYLALLGWSIAPDRDVFSMRELIDHFEISAVNPNPARFDPKKCVAINGEHIRQLTPDDFRNRLVPYLFTAQLVSDAKFEKLTDSEQAIVTHAAPLLQERIQLLGEAPAMLAFLFVPTPDLVYAADALEQLQRIENWPAIISQGLQLMESLHPFNAQNLHQTFFDYFVNARGLKPKTAFVPFRVALTGQRVSPPLFESMEILGPDATQQRLQAFLSAHQ